LTVKEYLPRIYYVNGVNNIIANMLFRVPWQDTPVAMIIQTFFIMETEHFPLAFAFIMQSQAAEKLWNSMQ